MLVLHSCNSYKLSHYCYYFQNLYNSPKVNFLCLLEPHNSIKAVNYDKATNRQLTDCCKAKSILM